MLMNTQVTATMIKQSKQSKLLDGFIIVSSLMLFIYAMSAPKQSWDMLGYAASVISIENSDKAYIHETIYQELELYLGDEKFKDLTESDSYRRTMFEDAEAFNQQIPFYKIRILFVLLILALSKLGINIFLACHIITASLTCSGFLIYYFAYKKKIHPLLLITIPFIFIGANIIYVARVTTADSLAFFWIGLICYTFFQQQWRMFFFLLASSVLVRTDMILLVGLFSAYFMIFRADLRNITGVSTVISIAAYLLVNQYAENYGWSTVFHFVFISDLLATHPAEYSSIGVSISDYFSAVRKNLQSFVYNHYVYRFELAIFFQLCIFTAIQKKGTSLKNAILNLSKDPIMLLTILSGFYLVIHFILFPLLTNRFFVAQYLIVELGLLSMISNLIEKSAQKSVMTE